MKERLEPNKHRIYEGRTRSYPTQEFMKEGLEPNNRRIYEERTRS